MCEGIFSVGVSEDCLEPGGQHFEILLRNKVSRTAGGETQINKPPEDSGFVCVKGSVTAALQRLRN